ncbi:MAG TPA: type II toxin-antitoxin system MqsA family antitoxin [Rhodanobacteraceae bacterium]
MTDVAATGGGHNAFSRYECGEARPVPAVINLFRLLGKHPELLEELRQANAFDAAPNLRLAPLEA